MFLMEYCSLRDLQGFGFADGLGTSSLSLLDQMAPECLGFLTAAKKLVLALRIDQQQAIWASRVTWEQTTLVSLIVAAV